MPAECAASPRISEPGSSAVPIAIGVPHPKSFLYIKDLQMKAGSQGLPFLLPRGVFCKSLQVVPRDGRRDVVSAQRRQVSLSAARNAPADGRVMCTIPNTNNSVTVIAYSMC